MTKTENNIPDLKRYWLNLWVLLLILLNGMHYLVTWCLRLFSNF